jgi:hypothetical protein
MAAKFNSKAAIQKLQKRLEVSLKKIEAVRSKVEKEIAVLKAQAKAVAEAERAKRRARRGS